MKGRHSSGDGAGLPPSLLPERIIARGGTDAMGRAQIRSPHAEAWVGTGAAAFVCAAAAGAFLSATGAAGPTPISPVYAVTTSASVQKPRQRAPRDAAGGAAGETGEVARGIVTVAAAASLRDAITRIAAKYQEAHLEAQVRPVFGASSMLARQILEGAPVDVILLADARSSDLLEKAGRLAAGTRVDLLTNSVVAIVPPRSALRIASPQDLAGAAVQKIALCDDAVPIGHYARSWLAAKGLLAPLEGRLVRPDDARATLAMVESGAVDLGFVYRTDARAAKRSRIVLEIPSSETPGIVYPAAIVKDGPNPAGGRSLFEFVKSPASLSLFEAAGFERSVPR